MQIYELLPLLNKVKKTGDNKWDACCPAHDDKTPSLGIKLEGTKILMNCMRGCPIESICGAIDIEVKDLHTDTPETQNKTSKLKGLDLFASVRGHEVKAYNAIGCKSEKREIHVPMRDAGGEIIGWRRRRSDNTVFFDDKKALTIKGGSNGLIYNPEALTDCNTVLLCEGETDLAAAMSHEPTVAAIATPGATPGKSVLKMIPRLCAGKKVYLCPDPDEAGDKWTSAIKFHLYGASCDIRVVPPAGEDLDARLKGGETLKKILLSAMESVTKQDESPDAPLSQSFNLTDSGNGRRMAYYFGHKIRYLAASKIWLIWDGRRWRPDDLYEIREIADATVRKIYEEGDAIKVPNNASKEDREEIGKRKMAVYKWATKCEAETSLKNMIANASSKPGLPVRPQELDRDHWLLNCENGTLNLKGDKPAREYYKLALEEHQQENMISKICPVEYDWRSACPVWANFLKDIMGGDHELMDYLQRAVGYSLTGFTSEQCLFFLYGTGQNGKSTFIETIEHIMGDYSQKGGSELIEHSENQRVPTEIARLKGARFVAAAETEEGKRMAESKVKDLTGGDKLVARHLYGNEFEFYPTHKLWIYGNHKPQVHGTDEGIWRRIHLIPFTVHISDEKKDPDLKDKLFAERSGIMAWAVAGCLEWQLNGLMTPDKVKAATNDYRHEMDKLAGFMEECCEMNPRGSVAMKELYIKYQTYCEESGERPLGKKRFGNKLTERGIYGENDPRTNKAIRIGINLRLTEVESSLPYFD